jgi:hypothetical protein
MTKEEGQEYIGKVFKNVSRWSKDGTDYVRVVAFDYRRKKFYVQHTETGSVEWVDTDGNGEHFLCGGIWLKIELGGNRC